jgi:pimeloyl-ACP methyl ester carboxylesterase
LGKLAGKFIVGWVGDVAIYCTTDQKSGYYVVREQMLSEALCLLRELLSDADGYDQVILAGHSLGSVIGYDMLNRLDVEANWPPPAPALNVGRLCGFVTFGSPLDMVAYFFGQHAGPGQYVRRQIMEQVHSVRAAPAAAPSGGPRVHWRHTPTFAQLPWYNFHHAKDLISSDLALYDVAAAGANVALAAPHQGLADAHTGYWTDPAFYQAILAYLPP